MGKVVVSLTRPFISSLGKEEEEQDDDVDWGRFCCLLVVLVLCIVAFDLKVAGLGTSNKSLPLVLQLTVLL